MDSSQLPSLAWFACIAHHRSFTKAAAEMGVSRALIRQLTEQPEAAASEAGRPAGD